MLDRVLSLIAPHICCSCGQNKALLCNYCFYDIISDGFDQCLVCLRPTVHSNLCTTCRPKRAFDDAWVVSERAEGLRELIDRYKFDRVQSADRVLVRLLDARLPQLPPDTIVTYIPTINAHRRQRGYDHMQRLAVGFASIRQLPTEPLLRRMTSLPQRGFTREEREVRQRGAFEARRDVTQPVLLLDDIYTTGATIAAGVAALRARSSSPIFVSAIARQPFD